MRRAWLILGLLLAPAMAWGNLTAEDRETQALEAKVADDPRAALKEAADWHERAIRAADRAAQLKALRLRIMALSQLEDTHAMSTAADAALPLARELKSAQAECEFLTVKGYKLSSEGKFVESQRVYDQALAVAEAAGLKRAAHGVLLAKAFDLSLMGRDADALELLSKAHQAFTDLGDAVNARLTLAAIGNAYFHERSSVEDLRKAASYYERAVSPDAERTRRHELATSYANLGAVHQRLKDFPKSRKYLDRAEALYRALGDPIGQAFAHYRLGLVANEEKKWLEALVELDKALAAFAASGESTMQFNVQRARAAALAELDRKRESLDALHAVETIAEKSDSAWIKANALSSAAETYARLGEYDRAYKAQRALRDADQALARESREKDEKEIKARFDIKQKESENALLRARQQESDARRLVLVLTIALLLVLLGGLSWYIWRQRQQNRRFADLALRDDLTGLPNRRSIIEFARGQYHQALTHQQKLVIALIDIDHFKPINDEHGHAVGDKVLTAFATLCQQQLRSNDRLGRYGGEEFMLVMPGSDIAQAPQVFTRLRLAMRQLDVEGWSASHQLTFSMGAADLNTPGEDLDAIIKRADEALYRAKQGGRDRHETG
ncbi:MAG: GGDEF domain-containing protein [Betaproteobacteria bacterium]|nr:GGDEF domain-containing protein [Betaproteobacteria bacterium]